MPFRNGVYMNDMAVCEGKVGWVYGFSGGDKGKDCILRDINGEIIQVSSRNKKSTSVPFSSLDVKCHNNNWQYVVI